MVFKYVKSGFTKIALVAVASLITGWGGGGGGSNIPIPKSQSFQNNLSSYNIVSGEMRQLTPAADFELYELSSELFTDYASKQRLISVPEGSQVTRLSSGELSFPEGTMLVKTFYYPNNAENALTNESQIVETRLLVKAQVAVVQGSAFGLDGYFRISYATSMKNLKKAIIRIKNFCEGLN